jgi:hypothetical protein
VTNWWSAAGLVLDILGVLGVAFIPMRWGWQGLGRTILMGAPHAWWWVSWVAIFFGFVLQLVGQFYGPR